MQDDTWILVVGLITFLALSLTIPIGAAWDTQMRRESERLEAWRECIETHDDGRCGDMP